MLGSGFGSGKAPRKAQVAAGKKDQIITSKLSRHYQVTCHNFYGSKISLEQVRAEFLLLCFRCGEFSQPCSCRVEANYPGFALDKSCVSES